MCETNPTLSLELSGRAYNLYYSGMNEEKRDLLEDITSNLVIDGKKVDLTLVPPFEMVAKRSNFTYGGPQRGIHRTRQLFDILVKYFSDKARGDPSAKSPKSPMSRNNHYFSEEYNC